MIYEPRLLVAVSHRTLDRGDDLWREPGGFPILRFSD
jgi:hypothetical protein